MTDARNTETEPAAAPPSVLTEIIQERFGPNCGGERSRQIAALHAVANWYALHDDIPVPTYVQLVSYTDHDEMERLARVYGQTPYGPGAHQFHINAELGAIMLNAIVCDRARAVI